ncbi:MAG: hypothetical protein V4560_03065 [Bacteroidota bacterium]
MELKDLIEYSQYELTNTPYLGQQPRIISYEVNVKGNNKTIIEYSLEFLADENEPSGWKYDKVKSTIYKSSDK